jgi:ligand-binding sensor protein
MLYGVTDAITKPVTVANNFFGIVLLCFIDSDSDDDDDDLIDDDLIDDDNGNLNPIVSDINVNDMTRIIASIVDVI